MLEETLKEQLKAYLELLERDVTFLVDARHDKEEGVLAFLQEVASLSPRLSIKETELPLAPSFTFQAGGQKFGITFAAIPLGHEFESFVLALLQVGGRAPKISAEEKAAIEKIDTDLHFETAISLSCHNCPEVVQAINIMAVLNDHVSQVIVDGSLHTAFVEERNVFAVPTVFLNGEEWHSGRSNLKKILGKLDLATSKPEVEPKTCYDLLVIGGGPAGISAAIYAARKGISTALIAENFGGQVMDTLGIENMIGQIYTEGPKLMGQMHEHLKDYPVDVFEDVAVEKISTGDHFTVHLADEGSINSQALVVATGAHWRLINVPGEMDFQNKGISYCTHCDGPLYEGKPVVVIGGGNSGIEAALDLAGLVDHVTVLEFQDHLNADEILVQRLQERDNVDIVLQAQTTAIVGEGHVEKVQYEDRKTGDTHELPANGVFILVGLKPNTDFLGDLLEENKQGEIKIDAAGQTNVPGLYAAGDCTSEPYKQIVVALGGGAKASLSAYDWLLREGKLT